MPAPVSKTVLLLILSRCSGVDVRNSARAAIAPGMLAAAAGMIVGAGRGAVYGMRINGPPTISSSRFLLQLSLLHGNATRILSVLD